MARGGDGAVRSRVVSLPLEVAERSACLDARAQRQIVLPLARSRHHGCSKNANGTHYKEKEKEEEVSRRRVVATR
jgi:hypothetical protein